MRQRGRRGQDWIGLELGIPERTVGAILARHQAPLLRECDPLTGELIRASETTTLRHERETPGDLVHTDINRIGRIPPDGGWRADGRGERPNHKGGLRYDDLPASVDDHSRPAYAKVQADEKGTTCAGFTTRAAGFFAGHAISINEVISDNAKNSVFSRDFQNALAHIRTRHLKLRLHCP